MVINVTKPAKRLKCRCKGPSPVWHLDEVSAKIDGKMVYLWRAVDDEGTVLDVVVQHKRNTKATLGLLRKLLRNHSIKPTRTVTDSFVRMVLPSDCWVLNTYMT